MILTLKKSYHWRLSSDSLNSMFQTFLKSRISSINTLFSLSQL